MKPIFKFLFKIIWWILVVSFGIIYSVLYFIYDPKALIAEKKKEVRYIGMNLGIDWKVTLSDENFWCPFIIS